MPAANKDKKSPVTSTAWKMNRETRGLIVHADDFGETSQITRGICETLDAGVVTSTTIMANMPATDEALANVARYRDSVSFGLHLNLCEGRPLTRCRSLTGSDGNFLPKRQLAARAVTRRVDGDEVAAEIEAQASRLVAAGVRVSHIDGHKHLHHLPVVSKAVVRVARQLGIERARRSLARGSWKRGPGEIARSVLAARAGRLYEEQRIRFPSQLVDITELMDAGHDAAVLRLSDCDGIVEVFCHPGTAEADREKPGSCERSQELDYLLSDRWAAILRDCRRPLVSYWSV